MMQALLQSLIAAELPVLAAHDVTMWGYVVLGALEDQAVRTQNALAEAIGADKTRIIGTLDRLQAAGLITREPDPRDRRARVLAITERGRAVREAVRARIQSNENRLLARLSPADRAGLLNALRTLSELPREEITGAGRP
ncbi:MarR family transcriptional regulator [Actinomadura sp. ATCC 31491]|uniref:MarR family transcriptional regulator n=1 Tax=Actinomadura luzonensis TaxID=2805427 RepID=A0ABT0FSU2_9ACTN|nr:MarR family transcriptional regulator [Actinomadura luzonensis]MCK2215412.1 MarR family transcriptional regulator [Actinomadura luzonensis]